jgi:hypothetical protein
MSVLLHGAHDKESPYSGFIPIILEVFAVLIAVGLHEFLTHSKMDEASEGAAHQQLFFWTTFIVLLSLVIRYFFGTHIHLHGSYSAQQGMKSQLLFLKDLLFTIFLAVLLVQIAESPSFVYFLRRTLLFVSVGALWCFTEVLYRHSPQRAEGTRTPILQWLILNLSEAGVTGVLLCCSAQSSENLWVPQFLAAFYIACFLIDFFIMMRVMQPR